jgi:hypothetical protein
MTNPTNPFNWQMPTASDLVTDLPADFETFGQAVATSMADLLGGTTGQVLSKASNTDMDFTWVAQDDSNAIQNAIVDAKGDLIAASAADTPARLAVGANGETLVADSSTSTGLRYGANWAAGKNAVINGAFDIWQRGTSFSYTGSGATTFTADRCSVYVNGNGTFTFSRQTFTPGAAPVAGYESNYFYRFAVNTLGTSTTAYVLQNKIENVTTFAGQTVTLSFWAKSDASRTVYLALTQYFGSGGSANVDTTSSVSVTTGWTRYSYTVALPSISGKTIGAGSYLQVRLEVTPTASQTLDIWGLQLENGSVATAFQTATGTLQGELAACQRYYYQAASNTLYGMYGWFFAFNTTTGRTLITNPVPMRTAASSVTYSNLTINRWGSGTFAFTTLTIQTTECNSFITTIDLQGSSGLTANGMYQFCNNNNAAGFLGVSAEL